MDTIAMQIEGNLGYGADQIRSEMTLGAMLREVEDAIERHGEDCVVVVHQTNNRYGANWGRVAQWEGMFLERDDDEED